MAGTDMDNRSEPELNNLPGERDAFSIFDELIEGPMRAQVPPVMKSTFDERPDIYNAVMAAGRPILFEGALPVSVKQMIVMLIASHRNCRFSCKTHKLLLQALGIDDALIDNCIQDPGMNLVPPMYRQIIRFAMLTAENPNQVDDRQFDQLRDSGLNDEEILEAAMVASFANFLVTWTDVRVSVDS